MVKALEEIADDEALIEIGRRAIEQALVEWRDDRLSQIRGNGLVICEVNGKPSSIIRFGPETALKIGLKAIAEALRALPREAPAEETK